MRIALLVLHPISACPYVISENLCGKNCLHAFQLSFLNECDTDPLCLPSSMPRGIFLWGMTSQTHDKSIHRLDTCFVICYYMEHSVMEEHMWKQSSACVTQLSQHCCKLHLGNKISQHCCKLHLGNKISQHCSKLHLGNKILYHSIALSYAWARKCYFGHLLNILSHLLRCIH